MNAPNTPGSEITRFGPYHQASSTQYGLEASIVSNGDEKPAKCRKCKTVAMPAHVTDFGKNGGMAVWCEAHCPRCIDFRQKNEGR